MKNPMAVVQLLAPALFCVMVLLAALAPQAQARITAPVSWEAGVDSLIVPYLNKEGDEVSYYVEVQVGSSMIRVRDMSGKIEKEFTGVELISQCADPTGSIIFNPRAVLLLFCSSSPVYYSIVLNMDTGSVRVNAVDVDQSFSPSQSPAPRPMVLKRGATPETRADVAIAVSLGDSKHCIGLYDADAGKAICQADEIIDFFFSSAPVPTEKDPNPLINLFVESQASTGVRIDSYNVNTFATGVKPNATRTLAFDASSVPLRSNINDADPSDPVFAYVQGTEGAQAQIKVVVVKSNTLDIFKEGSIKYVADQGGSIALSAYMVKTGSSIYLTVQMKTLVTAINYNDLKDGAEPVWKTNLNVTFAGLIFTPVANNKNWNAEVYRRQMSPSYTDYNPYHVIEATNVGFISDYSNYKTLSMTDGSVVSDIGPMDPAERMCTSGNAAAAIKTFEKTGATMYIGCQETGRYALVSVFLSSFHYSIQFPKSPTFSGSIYGYYDGINTATLTNGNAAAGVPLSPLLLYSTPDAQKLSQFKAAYFAGRVGILSVEGIDVPKFSFYSLDKTGDDTGTGPMTPIATFSNFTVNDAQGLQVTPFVAFFGRDKRYVAVGVNLKSVYVFEASNGLMVSPLNLDACIDDSGVVPSLSFLETVQHRGSQGDNYFVALGGTSSCVFEVNDTLSPRVSSAATAQDNTIIGTTQYSGYFFRSNNMKIEAHTSFFRENPVLVYEVEGLRSYVVGANVFVYIKDRSITCRSVRSDITVWTQELPYEYSGNVKHMSYYNNTVFVFDDNNYWQYNVQYIDGDTGESRVISSAPIGDPSTPIISAAVDKGTVIAITASTMYAFDAGDAFALWNVPMPPGLLSSSSIVSIVLYSPEDTGEKKGASGSAYIEVRVMNDGIRTVNLYALADGVFLRSVSRTPNDIAQQSIWKNMYVTYSDSARGLVAFRSLSLPSVNVPEQAMRSPKKTTPVYVPGEPPVDPPPPPLPRGDLRMAGSAPMTVAVLGEAALISGDRSRAVIAKLEPQGENTALVAFCFHTNDPNGKGIRRWVLKERGTDEGVNFIEFNSNQFIIQLSGGVQLYSWTTCETVGGIHSTGTTALTIPPFVSLPSQNRWIYLGKDEVIPLQSSTGNEEWVRKVRACSALKLVDNYLICDGGEYVSIMDSGSGEVVREDPIAGAVTSIEGHFIGVSQLPQGYVGVFYSSSGSVHKSNINLPESVGKVLAVLQGSQKTKFIVIFEFLVASISFSISETPTVATEWTNNMNGEIARLGGAAYVGDPGSSLVIGTSSGIIILRPSDGFVFSNISLHRTYREEENEAQNLKVISVGGNTYGVLWNGHSLMVNIDASVPIATAIFAFGSGRQRAAQLSHLDGFILVSSGRIAGAVPVNVKLWGSPMAYAVYGLNGKDDFIAGWDLTNSSNVMLRTVSKSNSFYQVIPKEKSLTGSAFVDGYGIFFGTKTISSIESSKGGGMVYALPDGCNEAVYSGFHRGDGPSSMSLFLYADIALGRNCVFLLSRNGAPPSHVSSLDQMYVSAANVRYGNSFALLTSDDLLVYGYDGGIKNSALGIHAVFVSSISSPDSGRGIFVASTQDTLICYQVENLVRVWSYTLNASSLRPVTYYNDSIFVSTESGPYRLLLAEFTYPCRDRKEFHVKREGSDNVYSKVEVNDLYGIGYVVTRSVFYAFDTSTGSVLWERPDLSSVADSKVLNKGKLLVVATGQGGHFLNPFTGATIMSFLNDGTSAVGIFTTDDDTTVGFGGSVATVVNLNDYASYFANIQPNRPSVSTPTYKPYNYKPSDKPNSCTKPTALPILVVTGMEWVTGQMLDSVPPLSVAVGPYWAASIWKFANVTMLDTFKTDRGIIFNVVRAPIEDSCDGLSLFSVSATSAFFGVRCGGRTIFYNGEGAKVGESSRVSKNGKSAAIGRRGYYMNNNDRVDSVSLNNFEPFPGVSATVECKSNDFDLISMPKSERLMLICPGEGIKMIHFARLSQMGSTIAVDKESSFTSYDYNDELAVGIACGNSGSSVYVVIFTSNAKVFVTDTAKARGSVVCGIAQPTEKSPKFIFAYANTIKTWPMKGGNSTTIEMVNFNPTAMGSEGVIYSNGSYDYYLKKFGDSKSDKVLLEGQSVSTGHIAVRGKDGTLGKSVIVFGDGFSFAVDTSAGALYWTGGGNLGTVYSTLDPFVYIEKKHTGFRGYYMANVSFSINGFTRVTPAEVNGKVVTFVSQPGSLGCLDTEGHTLWNVPFGNRDSQRIPFAPVVLNNYDYVLASGGGRGVAVIEKNSGDLLKSFVLDTCQASPDASEADVIVNGSTVYITIEGWSCTHIVDVSAITTPNLPIVETLRVVGMSGRLQPRSPIFARVEFANLLVYFAADPSDKGKNIFTVYRISNSPKERTLLWSASLASDPRSVSTYGYILYVSTATHLTAFDLLTGALAWTYNVKDPLIFPVVGADAFLYVSTVNKVLVLRSSINVPNSQRLIAELDFSGASHKAQATRATRTPYGQIIFSDGLKTWAYQHLRSFGQFAYLWSSPGYTRIATSFGDKFNSFATIDSFYGSGILDLSSGEVRWLNDRSPAVSMTLGIYSASLGQKPFVCSFASTLPNCRLLPDEFVKPSGDIALYKYDPEPLEKVPPGWVPVVDAVRPTDYCMGLMKTYIPEFASCMTTLILNIYPNGRDSLLDCPNDFIQVQMCMKHLNPLIQDCPDVVAYVASYYNGQTTEAASPMGMCDREEAERRCGTDVGSTLDQTCVFVTMKIDVNGYQNPPGYDISYSLPFFRFPGEEPVQDIGAIFGGIAGGVVGVALIIGIILYFLRRKGKQRDSRFFDDDDPSIPLRNDIDKDSYAADVPMKDMRNRSPTPTSKGGSVNLDTASASSLEREVGAPAVGPRKVPPPMPGKAPVPIPGKKGPKMPPPQGLRSIMDDDI